MKIFKNWKIKDNIKIVLETYPIVLICFFIIGALSIFSIHSNVDEDTIVKINFSIAIFTGFALILRALNICYEKITNKIHLILLIVSLGVSIAYYFTLNIDNTWTILRTFIIFFIQGLLFISLPFINNDDNVEHFVNQAAGRLIISGLLFGIAYGGIAGILFALEELFGLDISNKIYEDTAIILATTFLPMLWLYGLDYKVQPSTPRLYRVLLSYVCIPLLFVYSAVVYGFLLKIVFDGFVMPNSIIGNLVLWYSFVSIIVTYLARPYKDNSITAFFYKWYPVISVLPIVIMFIAIFMRIDQYSITINRYYLLLGGIWLAVMFGYFIFARFANKKRLNVFITLTLALFALISITEPMSAKTIAEHSQISRLEETITNNMNSGSLDVSKMTEDDKRQAHDILNYLQWQHDGYDIQYGSSASFDKNIDFMTQEQAKELLEIDFYEYDAMEDGERYFYANIRGNNNEIFPINISGFSYLVNINSYDFNNGDEYLLDEYKIIISDIYDNEDTQINSIIYIYKNDELFQELSLLECFEDNLLVKGGEFGNNLTDFVYVSPDMSTKIVLNDIDFWIDGEVSIAGFSGYLLLK